MVQRPAVICFAGGILRHLGCIRRRRPALLVDKGAHANKERDAGAPSPAGRTCGAARQDSSRTRGGFTDGCHRDVSRLPGLHGQEWFGQMRAASRGGRHVPDEVDRRPAGKREDPVSARPLVQRPDRVTDPRRTARPPVADTAGRRIEAAAARPAGPQSAYEGIALFLPSRISAGAMPANDRAAMTHHPWRKAPRAAPPRPALLPSTATRMATPRARPVCRIMLITADPVANDGGGSDAEAVAISVGSVRPTPMPVVSMPPRAPAT